MYNIIMTEIRDNKKLNTYSNDKEYYNIENDFEYDDGNFDKILNENINNDFLEKLQKEINEYVKIREINMKSS